MKDRNSMTRDALDVRRMLVLTVHENIFHAITKILYP